MKMIPLTQTHQPFSNNITIQPSLNDSMTSELKEFEIMTFALEYKMSHFFKVKESLK